jgi:hypothetical protein
MHTRALPHTYTLARPTHGHAGRGKYVQAALDIRPPPPPPASGGVGSSVEPAPRDPSVARALLVICYNRPEYLRRTLTSVLE